MAPTRIIIDTDPGVDDVLAILFALASKSEELQVLLLSIQFGNVDVQSCLRNVVSLFHYIERERAWREASGRPAGFDALAACKPIVAIGAEEPLAEQGLLSDFFHGIDGLGGIHHSHPHLSPSDTWKTLFKSPSTPLSPEDAAELQKARDEHSLFQPSLRPAHQEILQLLRENEPDTITMVAIGPLTNLALAAAEDPEAFLRAKEVVIMGGAIDVPGNMTPGAEFNIFADSIAAARIFALTSPNPTTTMPPSLGVEDQLPPYPQHLSRPLKLKIFPLDLTTPHLIRQNHFSEATSSLEASGSPLAHWASHFMAAAYRKIHSLVPEADLDTLGFQLHDPLPIWYCLTQTDSLWQFASNEDIRIETTGQWFRGTCMVDRRGMKFKPPSGDLDEAVAGDHGGWLDARKGNRVQRCVGTPGIDVFAGVLLKRIFEDVV